MNAIEKTLIWTVGIALLIGIIAGMSCLFGWLTMLCLGAFGIKAPFWGCALGWFLLSALLNTARSELKGR